MKKIVFLLIIATISTCVCCSEQRHKRAKYSVAVGTVLKSYLDILTRRARWLKYVVICWKISIFAVA